MLIEKEAIYKVAEILKAEDFYADHHAKIYTAILNLFQNSEQADTITVSEELRKAGHLEVVGGAPYLAELSMNVTSGANVEHHARIVKEKSIMRSMIRIGSNMISAGYNPSEDALDLVAKSQGEIFGIGSQTVKKHFVSIRDGIAMAIESLQKVHGTKDGLTGIPSGFKDLDNLTTGWQRGDLIIVAGRPSHGKTSMALNFADNAGKLKTSVGIFSLEMSLIQLCVRFLCAEGKINGQDARKGRLTDDDWKKAMQAAERLSDVGIYIDDSAGIGMTELRSKSLRLKSDKDVGLIIVDYLQLMTGDKKAPTREQEIAGISRGLKSLAKELNIPVIALSQLSRETERRKGSKMRPILSDLRDCLAVGTSKVYGEQFVQDPCLSECRVVSLNTTTGEAMVCDSIHVPKITAEVFRLTTDSGRFVDCTANHPILTSDGFKKLRDITKEDSIAVILDFGNWENTETIPEARFIGWMIGNGSMVGYAAPSFTTRDPVIAKEFCEFVEGFWGFTPKTHKHWSKNVFQYDLTYSPVRTSEPNVTTEWCKQHDLWGRRAPQKRIPMWFMETANKESLRELLRGLWETDGSVVVGGNAQLSYSTTSPELRDQILYILAKIGVFAFLDKGYTSDKATTPCFKIIIRDKHFFDKFNSQIKLSGYKGERQQKVKKINNSRHSNKLGLATTIELKEYFDKSVPKRIARIQGHGRRLGQNHLRKSLKALKSHLSTHTNKYDWLCSEHIAWDVVESIKRIGDKQVFDRSVGGSHNFVVNGIVVHNSGQIEQDADVVIFVHRPEMYYDKDEYKGMAEIIVAKQRNGPLDIVKLAFNASRSTFNNLSTRQEEPKTSKLPYPDDDLPF